MNASGPQPSLSLKEGDKTYANKSAIKYKVMDDTRELEIKGKKMVAYWMERLFLTWDGVESHKGGKIWDKPGSMWELRGITGE